MKALVTGASSGIGMALSSALAKEYETLIVVGRNREKLQELGKMLPCRVIVCATDLSTYEGRRQVIDLIHAECPDLMINGAGFGLYGEAANLPVEEQIKMIEVNCTAVTAITLEGAKMLKQYNKQGTILNISSAASFFEYPGFNVYAASKRFVSQFSKTLDVELKPHQIRVLTACPGMVATDFQRRASKGATTKHYGMSCNIAARFIIKQIKSGKRLAVFDFRYALGVKIAHLLPQKWVQAVLKKAIDARHKGASL